MLALDEASSPCLPIWVLTQPLALWSLNPSPLLSGPGNKMLLDL